MSGVWKFLRINIIIFYKFLNIRKDNYVDLYKKIQFSWICSKKDFAYSCVHYFLLEPIIINHILRKTLTRVRYIIYIMLLGTYIDFLTHNICYVNIMWKYCEYYSFVVSEIAIFVHNDTLLILFSKYRDIKNLLQFKTIKNN